MPDEHPMDGPLGAIHEIALFLALEHRDGIAIRLAKAHEALQDYIISENERFAALEQQLESYKRAYLHEIEVQARGGYIDAD